LLGELSDVYGRRKSVHNARIFLKCEMRQAREYGTGGNDGTGEIL
jgi:hypothetical protein